MAGKNVFDVEKVVALRVSAEKGDIVSQRELGLICFALAREFSDAADKLVVDRILHAELGGAGYHHAAHWFRKAAEQGDAESQFRLGAMYIAALGVPQDYGEAANWFHRGATQGHAGAQCELGLMYLHGDGVPNDRQKAVEWIHKAALQDHADALCNLGLMYLKEPAQPTSSLPKKAEALLQKAASQGHAQSQFVLGSMYMVGCGPWIPRNAPQALFLFQIASTGQGPYAQKARALRDTLVEEMTADEIAEGERLLRSILRER